MPKHTPRSTLFPYTTLFRSGSRTRRCEPCSRPRRSGAERGRWSRSTPTARRPVRRSEEHTSELQSRGHLVCRLLLEKKKEIIISYFYLYYGWTNTVDRLLVV